MTRCRTMMRTIGVIGKHDGSVRRRDHDRWQNPRASNLSTLICTKRLGDIGRNLEKRNNHPAKRKPAVGEKQRGEPRPLSTWKTRCPLCAIRARKGRQCTNSWYPVKTVSSRINAMIIRSRRKERSVSIMSAKACAVSEITVSLRVKRSARSFSSYSSSSLA